MFSQSNSIFQHLFFFNSSNENSLTFFCHLGNSHDHHGDSDSRGEDPDGDVDKLGFGGRAEVQGLDRMTHSDVAIHAHHGEREDAGEHVVVVNGYHHFTQELPKRPRAHQVLGALERKGAGGESVGQSQVEDVNVCGCLHLRVPVWWEEKCRAHFKQIVTHSGWEQLSAGGDWISSQGLAVAITQRGCLVWLTHDFH